MFANLELADVEEKVARTKTELTGLEASLRQRKTDLRVANASANKLKAENLRKHNAEIEEKIARSRQLDVAIGDANGQLDRLAAQTRDAQAQHQGVVDCIAALSAQLERRT